MSFVEAPTYSPDGAWIVFDADDGGGANLYLMRSDGTHVHPVADTPGYDWAPSWSPDGRWIVYSKDGSGSPIMVVQRDGTHRHRVGTGLGEYARYSPDGTKIAYGGSDNQIHVMRSDGSNDHAITNAGGNDYPDWSPGGRLIGFTSDLSGTSQVWVARPDGSHARQVTTSGANYSPSFSPDGTRVAYLTSTTGSPVWSALLDGTHVRTVVGATGGCCIGWQAIRGTG
jgi:TolB protein